MFSATAAAAAPENDTLAEAVNVRPLTQIPEVDVEVSEIAPPESTVASEIFVRVVLPMSLMATETPMAKEAEPSAAEKASATAPATAPMSDVSLAVRVTS